MRQRGLAGCSAAAWLALLLRRAGWLNEQSRLSDDFPGDVTPARAEAASWCIMRTSHAWIATYAVTGALQPLLVDWLKQQGLAPARLLGPMMANLLGMTLVAPAREACVGSPAPIAQTIRASWRPLAAAAALDFGSAALLCVGLLYAGAAAFTLVYASCAPLVSAIGAAAGAQIRREQWVAIVLAV